MKMTLEEAYEWLGEHYPSEIIDDDPDWTNVMIAMLMEEGPLE